MTDPFEKDKRRQQWADKVLAAVLYGEPDPAIGKKYEIKTSPLTVERLLELMFGYLSESDRRELLEMLRKGRVAPALDPVYVTSMLRNILDDKTETELLLRGRKKMKTVPGNNALKITDAVKILTMRLGRGRSEYRINEILRELELDSPQWAQFVEQHNKKLEGKRRELGAKAYQELRRKQMAQEKKRTNALLK